MHLTPLNAYLLLNWISRALAQTISNDGSCGNGITCSGSLYGTCCSAHGFCGNGDAYCGAGCQADFGFCGSLAPTSSPPVGGSQTTVTVTRTVTALTTSLLPPTTLSVTRTVTALTTAILPTTLTITGSVTRTILTTATNVVSRTDVRTLTQTTTTTATAAVLSTSVIPVYSTSIKYLTQIVLVTSTAGCAPAPTTVAPSPTGGNPSAPSPTLVGSSPECTKWYKTRKGEDCQDIAAKNGIALALLMAYNPVGKLGRYPICPNDPAAVTGLCRVDCEALWVGWYLCVAVN